MKKTEVGFIYSGVSLTGILPDYEIRKLCIGTSEEPLPKEHAMIWPFEEGIKRPGVISYGLGHYGYDIRVGYKFKIFNNANCSIMDPKTVDEEAFWEKDITPNKHKRPDDSPLGGWYCAHCGDIVLYGQSVFGCLGVPNHILIPPNSYILAETIETFNVPPDILGVCIGKSTYARVGLIVNVTPEEPAWKGKLTIEISNSAPIPCRLYAGEGVAQMLFFRSMAASETNYQTKNGKYQNQTGLTTSKVD